MAQLDRLTGQLYHLPAIVGRLGLSIAEAQKELDANYLNTVRELIHLIANTLGNDQGTPEANKEKFAAFRSLLESLAPSRYQFTETTLDFSADLAEHLSVGAEVGASVGLGAVAVNAAVSVGYARDYRAAARVTTVMHAFQSAELAKGLMERAKSLADAKLEHPERAEVDKEIWESTAEVFKSLGGKPKADADDPTPPE